MVDHGSAVDPGPLPTVEIEVAVMPAARHGGVFDRQSAIEPVWDGKVGDVAPTSRRGATIGDTSTVADDQGAPQTVRNRALGFSGLQRQTPRVSEDPRHPGVGEQPPHFVEGEWPDVRGFGNTGVGEQRLVVDRDDDLRPVAMFRRVCVAKRQIAQLDKRVSGRLLGRSTRVGCGSRWIGLTEMLDSGRSRLCIDPCEPSGDVEQPVVAHRHAQRTARVACPLVVDSARIVDFGEAALAFLGELAGVDLSGDFKQFGFQGRCYLVVNASDCVAE